MCLWDLSLLDDVPGDCDVSADKNDDDDDEKNDKIVMRVTTPTAVRSTKKIPSARRCLRERCPFVTNCFIFYSSPALEVCYNKI